jgi:hypothetical protein
MPPARCLRRTMSSLPSISPRACTRNSIVQCLYIVYLQQSFVSKRREWRRWSADGLQIICRPSADGFNGVRNPKYCIQFKAPLNENPYFSFNLPLNLIQNLKYRQAYRPAWYL